MSLRERIKQISDELTGITILDTGTWATRPVQTLIKCVHCGGTYYYESMGMNGKVKYCPHCGVITEECDDT